MLAFNAVRAAVFAAGLCVFSCSAFAGGPVRATLTVGDLPLAVDVSWYQSGGVVILKIVSDAPLLRDERDAVLAAAESMVIGRTGGRAAIATTGQLMLGLKLSGWTRSFTAADLEPDDTPEIAGVQQ